MSRRIELLSIPSIPEDMCLKQVCGRCYAETDELVESGCSEKPETLKGQPLGMYHCPDCGAMLLAGIPHPPICRRCLDEINSMPKM